MNMMSTARALSLDRPFRMELAPRCSSFGPVSFGLMAGLLALLVALSSGPPALADDGGLQGRFRLGYRFVDTSGSATKYKEDLNLESGARLFELRLDFDSPDSSNSWVDRLNLDVHTFGGDPFETLHLRVQRYGAFDFRFDRSTSTYFYEDVILPLELSNFRLSNAGDLHHFDFERVRDRASLQMTLSPAAKVTIGFDRWTKRGDSTTTLDVSRDEFELDQPVDESLDQIRVGLSYSWKKATLVLEERYTEYRNAAEIFLPGASSGENPAGAELDFFFYDRPYDYESNEHVVRLTARPHARLLLTTSALFSELDLDAEAAQRGRGISFSGTDLDIDRLGSADIERDAQLFDVDLSYLITDRLALVGGVRRHGFEQTGRGSLGTTSGSKIWDVETTGGELGLEMTARPGMTLAFGVLAESREVSEDELEEMGSEVVEISTDHQGFFGRFGWKVNKHLRLDASLEESSYDDPFTLSAPTDRRRLRAQAKYSGDNGLYGDGTWLSYRFDNSNSGWASERDQWSLRLGLRRSGLDVSAGYNLIESQNAIDQTVTTLPGFGGGVEFLYPVLYRSDADFADARLRWRRDRLELGAEVRLYDNRGTFGVEREDIRAFVEIPCWEKYLLNLAYRSVDYDEDEADWDDYGTDIFELSIGYEF